MKKPIPLEKAYRVVNPGGVVLVSAHHDGVDGIFSAAWNLAVRMDPPLVGVLCGKRHFTWPLIEASGEFALSLPPASLINAVLGLGATSGKDVADKFARFGLHRETASEIGAPLVAEAAASLECHVEQIVDLGRSALIIGRVVAARADERYFKDGEWIFEEEGFGLLHHVGGSHFAVSDHVVTAVIPEEPTS